mgnify:CR=1 FL=1
MARMLASLRGAVFEPLHCTLTHSSKLAYWRELERTQYKTEDELRHIQWKRLKEQLRFVYENNRYYHDTFVRHGVTPDDLKSPGDIGKLPVLTKKDIRDNAHKIISNGYRRDGLMSFKTGGSTGKSLELYITEECSHLRNACAIRHDRWTGWEIGDTVGAVWGNPILPKGIKQNVKHWLLTPTIYLDTMNISDEAVLEFVKQWKSAKPTLLFGHAHSIFMLAKILDRLGTDLLKPRGILSTSMMLMPNERSYIENVFNIKVTDRYGCEEVSLIASECERHEGMHLNIEHLFIEFIKEDGRPAESGETGRIIVTDLMNKAMPFIRYQIEDMGIPSAHKCSCGRGLPLMDHVVGRTADFLIRRDGSRVAGISLIENTLTKIPGIEQMQIVQEGLNHIVLNIVAGRSFTQSAQKDIIVYFQQQFGTGTHVAINQVSEIEVEKSGKYRFSICKVDAS